MKNVKIILGFLFVTFLTSCSSIYEKEPVGIGGDINELKRSPCACMLLETPKNLPDWILQG